MRRKIVIVRKDSKINDKFKLKKIGFSKAVLSPAGAYVLKESEYFKYYRFIDFPKKQF
jgi:hypothetical protein